MSPQNVSLVVAAYGSDTSAAAADFKAIKALDDAYVVAAVVMETDADGKVEVTEHGGGLVAAGTSVGAGGGFVVGLFAPPLLLATAVGAGIGAGVGVLRKRHDEKAIGVDAEQWLPPASSAIAAVVDELYLDRVDRAVGKATQKVNRPSTRVTTTPSSSPSTRATRKSSRPPPPDSRPSPPVPRLPGSLSIGLKPDH